MKDRTSVIDLRSQKLYNGMHYDRYYKASLLREGVFSGTDDVLIQDPEGNQILTYTGFEK